MLMQDSMRKMEEIVDIHTHRFAPVWGALVNIRVSFPDTDPMLDSLRRGQLYSAGVHPWDTGYPTDDGFWTEFEALISRPDIAAIGECGVDLKNSETPLFRQLQVFKRQIELSEKLHKPLIIHDVKADGIICGLRRDLKPHQPWVIHGFRGKPAAAQALLRAGCYISFGEKFNAETVSTIPEERILAETDESELDIYAILGRISEARGMNLEDLTAVIKRNSEKFCNFEKL